MNPVILFTKEELRYYSIYFDGTEKYKPLSTYGGLCNFITAEVKFAEELTFQDFFSYLLAEKDMFNQIFHFSLRGVRLEDYIKELEDQTPEEEIRLEYVQLAWRLNIESDDELDFNPIFSGVRKGSDGHRKNGVETAIGLGLTPLTIYKHLPIKLNELLIVEDYRSGEVELLLEGKKRFTVYDIISALLFEICWYGPPKKREQASKEIQTSIEEAEKNPGGISIEELMKELDLEND